MLCPDKRSEDMEGPYGQTLLAAEVGCLSPQPPSWPGSYQRVNDGGVQGRSLESRTMIRRLAASCLPSAASQPAPTPLLARSAHHTFSSSCKVILLILEICGSVGVSQTLTPIGASSKHTRAGQRLAMTSLLVQATSHVKHPECSLA